MSEEPGGHPFQISIGESGRILSSQYVIVKNIVSALPMRDLFSCAQVCTLWRSVVEICIREQKRYAAATFWWSDEPSSYYSSHLTSPHQNYLNFRDPAFFNSPSHIQLENELKKFSKSLLIQPQLIVAVGSVDLDTREESQLHSWLFDPSTISKVFPGSHSLGISSSGVVGTHRVRTSHSQKKKPKNGESGQTENGSSSKLEDGGASKEKDGAASKGGSGGASKEKDGAASKGESGAASKEKDGGGWRLETVEEENPIATKPCLSLLCIPAVHGVRVVPFHIVENSFIEMMNETHEDPDLIDKKILERSIPALQDSDKIAAVVVLSNGLEMPYCTNVLQTLAKREKNKLAIGGAVGNLTWASESKDSSMVDIIDKCVKAISEPNEVPRELDEEIDYLVTSGFLIIGEKVQTASLILNRKVKKEKEILAKLTDLKGKVREENSFAFMFACCGRGAQHYKGKAQVESSLFRQVFPNTPLFGLFGNGEIGINYIPGTQDSYYKYKGELKLSQLYHSYSTIFLFVSLAPS